MKWLDNAHNDRDNTLTMDDPICNILYKTVQKYDSEFADEITFARAY